MIEAALLRAREVKCLENKWLNLFILLYLNVNIRQSLQITWDGVPCWGGSVLETWHYRSTVSLDKSLKQHASALTYLCAYVDETLMLILASPISKMLVFGILRKLCQWLNEMAKWSWVSTRVVSCGREGLSQGRSWIWVLTRLLTVTCLA